MANEINLNISLGVANSPFAKTVQKTIRANQLAIGNASDVLDVLFESGKVPLGPAIKPSAKAATTGALAANTYSNGTLGVGATLTATGNGAIAAVDGVTLALHDYVLVKNEVAGANKGLYQVTTVGDGSNPYVLTRQTSMDQTGEFVGASVYIEGGSTLGGTWWCCTNASVPTLGSTAITFAQAASGTLIDVGSITDPGMLYLSNMDGANFACVGPTVGGVMMPALKIAPGDIGCVRVDGNQTFRALADTADVQLYYEIFET